MTWATHAAQQGRVPCWAIELDLDYYDDVSVVAVNDDDSFCYRTPKTTLQEAATLTLTTKTRRWMTHTQRPIPELGAIPCVSSVKITAEEVRIGRGLSNFGQVSIDLVDFVDDDFREDPFYSDTSRDGVDHRAGTYFGKLLARNPYWTGRAIRVIEGWATDGVWHAADAITRHYYIRDVQGPTNGKVRITAAGPLQLLNLNDKEAPEPSPCTLVDDITSTGTTAEITPSEDVTAYAAIGYGRIGDEVVQFTRSGSLLALNRDGHFHTLPDAHSAGDGFQEVLVYTEQNVVDIILDLLTTFGGVSTDLIAIDEWNIEKSTWLSLYTVSGIVSKPEKLLDLVQELLEAAAAIMWWDDEIGQIRLKALRPATSSLGTWTDRLHLLTPMAVNRDVAQRVSRMDMLIDLRAADLDTKEAASYRTRVIGAPQGEEITAHQTSQIRLVASRWLSSAQLPLALRAISQVTEQLRDGRRTYVVEVAAKDAARKIGDVVEILSRDIVDTEGNPKRTRCYVVKREPILAGSRYRYTLEFAPFTGRFAYMTDSDFPDYDDAASWQRDPGAFMCNTAGIIPNPPYLMG